MRLGILFILFISVPSFALEQNILFSKNYQELIPVRDRPQAIGSQVIATLPTGTEISILEKSPEKTRLGTMEDY
ncbi:MAG: hypothetical protein HYS98_00710, partial [Deltaproteobacteria bacterium]|nr:hypothetical protein [Deltaproteobacteria bacterium]